MYDYYDIEPDNDNKDLYDENSPFPDDHNDNDFKSIMKSMGNKKRKIDKNKKTDNNKNLF